MNVEPEAEKETLLACCLPCSLLLCCAVAYEKPETLFSNINQFHSKKKSFFKPVLELKILTFRFAEKKMYPILMPMTSTSTAVAEDEANI